MSKNAHTYTHKKGFDSKVDIILCKNNSLRDTKILSKFSLLNTVWSLEDNKKWNYIPGSVAQNRENKTAKDLRKPESHLTLSMLREQQNQNRYCEAILYIQLQSTWRRSRICIPKAVDDFLSIRTTSDCVRLSPYHYRRFVRTEQNGEKWNRSRIHKASVSNSSFPD